MLSSKVGVIAGPVGAGATSLALATSASADTSARSGAIVIVGSDTLTNVANFLTDGTSGVSGGYNNLLNIRRAVEIDATGDANNRLPYDGTCGPITPTDRVMFCDVTSNQELNALPGPAILRFGHKVGRAAEQVWRRPAPLQARAARVPCSTTKGT